MDAEKSQDVVSVSQDSKMSETEKALFKRMKGVMKKEVEQIPTAATRRGFLHTLLAGGIVAGGGVAGIAIVGSSNSALAGVSCTGEFSCAPNFTCGDGNSCSPSFTCNDGYDSGGGDPPTTDPNCPFNLTPPS